MPNDKPKNTSRFPAIVAIACAVLVAAFFATRILKNKPTFDESSGSSGMLATAKTVSPSIQKDAETLIRSFVALLHSQNYARAVQLTSTNSPYRSSPKGTEELSQKQFLPLVQSTAIVVEPVHELSHGKGLYARMQITFDAKVYRSICYLDQSPQGLHIKELLPPVAPSLPPASRQGNSATAH